VVVEHVGMDEDVPMAAHHCEACRIIDESDGKVDGNFTDPRHYRSRHERTVMDRIVRGQDRVADRITAFAGSLTFVYIHTIWFGIWILANAGAFGDRFVFDKFPYGLLTMVVSLEAIFLSTFVMVTQNRQAKRSDIRADIDFETNVRSEIWSIHIGEKLGVDALHVEDIVRRAIAGYRADGTTEGPTGSAGERPG
jgi:uncharacterized membrane protein